MAKGKKKSEVQEVLEVVTFIKERMATKVELDAVEVRLSGMESEMMKMRDDIRAVDSKVSGIWNVIDLHADRIKKLESDIERLKAKTR